MVHVVHKFSHEFCPGRWVALLVVIVNIWLCINAFVSYCEYYSFKEY